VAATEGILDGHRPTPTERLARLARAEIDRAYRLAGLILGNAGEAEDAVGDALERAHRSINQLRDEAQFQAWFDRIVVNACRDRLRRRRLVRFVPIDAAGERSSPRDPFVAVLEADAALRAIDILSPDERAIVVLRYWADLPVEEIGRRLGVPGGTVKSRLHRALARMREDAR
jgi:RNA polymerase sigma-70 factor (ECF subfamily)